ncbi:uncharacterized protein LOC129746540 [Uranotaenia lowii]|uniref:uncharacterized protein LOC129746540 n=1 Tax=Uranotaenia lowii TaxID=190385 RepID=UPI00247943EB|nr:uncharacterized protein LOC129746540 [Uranotaenia lowii]
MQILLHFRKLILLLAVAFDAVSYSNAFIVPEELPSILSLVYSNIPPIKKGTDSRLGFGFRLGDHADFQVQLELGPQQRTRPIGTLSGSSKRDADNENFQQSPFTTSGTATSGKSWLQTWFKETKKKQQFNKDKYRDELANGTVGKGTASLSSAPSEMPASPMINEAAFNQLQQLYGMNKQQKDDTIGTVSGTEMDERLLQLQALRRDTAVSFKPLPPSAAENEVQGSELQFKPLPVSTMTAAGGQSKPTTIESSKPSPAQIITPRRNLKRRTNSGPNRSNNQEKDKITAELSDVSLD